jgi:hypothetical protein
MSIRAFFLFWYVEHVPKVCPRLSFTPYVELCIDKFSLRIYAENVQGNVIALPLINWLKYLKSPLVDILESTYLSAVNLTTQSVTQNIQRRMTK